MFWSEDTVGESEGLNRFAYRGCMYLQFSVVAVSCIDYMEEYG